MSAFIPAPPEAWAAATNPEPDAARVALGCPDWCTTPAQDHEVGPASRGGRVLLAVFHAQDVGAVGYLSATSWLVPDGNGGPEGRARARAPRGVVGASRAVH